MGNGFEVKARRAIVAMQDPDGRLDLEAALARAGVEVVSSTGDAGHALAAAAELAPDVVVLDARVADMDERLFADSLYCTRTAPVIVVTDAGDAALRERCRSGRVAAVLVRPVTEAALVPAMEVAIEQLRRQSRLESRVDELEEQLRTRKVVEIAKGVLMDRYGLREREAFRRIQKASMDSRTPMGLIAEAIIVGSDVVAAGAAA